MPHAVSPSQTYHHIVLSDLSADTYKTYTVVSARVYHTPLGPAGAVHVRQREWTYTQLRGLLVFGRDRTTPQQRRNDNSSSSVGHGHASSETSKYWFKLVDEISGRTVWTFRVPMGVDYQMDKPFFHIFSGKSRMFGFCFDRDDEAAEFLNKVKERTTVKPPPKPQPTIPPAPAPTPTPPPKTTPKKPKPALLTRKGRISTSMISSPSPDTFVHVAHVGVNAHGTVEPSGNLDSSWHELINGLQGYGITPRMVEKNLDFVEGFLAGAQSAKKHSSHKVVHFQEPPTRTIRRKTPG